MNHSKALTATQNKTQAEYLRRISLALEYIEQHLHQTIRLEEVAKASFFSAYHFHRIFHALVGETVNEFISRKRMEKAIRMLMREPGLTVTEVAEAGGFSSSANFAKAFKLHFGLSPSAIRKPDSAEMSKTGKLYRKYGKAFNAQDLYSQFVTQSGVFDPDKLEDMLMQVKVQEIQEKPVAFLTSPGGYQLDSIHATWDRMIQWGVASGIEEQAQTRLAICHDNPVITPEDRCRYDAAIVIAPDMEVAAPYTRSTIPAGKYAIAYYKDEAEKISSFMTELCSQWLCNSGYEPDNYPPIFNYLNDARNGGDVEMDVYIKLKTLELK